MHKPQVVTEIKLALFGEAEVLLFQQFVSFLETSREGENIATEALAHGGAFGCGEATAPAFVTPPNAPVAAPVAESDPGTARDVTEADVVASLRAFIARKGVDEAVKLLASFGVKRAGELTQEQRGPFCSKAAA